MYLLWVCGILLGGHHDPVIVATAREAAEGIFGLGTTQVRWAANVPGWDWDRAGRLLDHASF